MPFSMESKGPFNLESYLNKVKKNSVLDSLEKFGRQGVQALSRATPKDTSETANSWTYTIEKTSTSWTITWRNTNIAAGKPIALLLQYGHGTGTGGYVQGRDYINPVIRPLFERMADEAFKAVSK